MGEPPSPFKCAVLVAGMRSASQSREAVILAMDLHSSEEVDEVKTGRYRVCSGKGQGREGR